MWPLPDHVPAGSFRLVAGQVGGEFGRGNEPGFRASYWLHPCGVIGVLVAATRGWNRRGHLGKRIAPDSPMLSLAHNDSIEASYIYQRESYYYLFVNWGTCCKGANSTYNIRLGRSRKITGPYVDKDGVNLIDGGGSLFLGTKGPLIGPGHAGIIVDKGTNWFSCHFEADGTQRRGSVLAIIPLRWNADGWPELDVKPAP